MKAQQFGHLKGGVAIGIIFIALAIIIVGVIILLLMNNVLSSVKYTILIFGAFGVALWVIARMCRAMFTVVTFSESEIASKTLFMSDTLKVSDVKGIWTLRHPYNGMEAESYTLGLDSKQLKGRLVIIGDIKHFDDARFMASSLVDSFAYGYTALYYRKDLDDVLAYYYKKIKERDAEQK